MEGKIKISEIMPVIYEISKKVYQENLSPTEGSAILFNEYKMNITYAKYHIIDFKLMMKGKQFTRRLSTYAVDYFIEYIKREYGDGCLRLALSALAAHIKYYDACHSGKAVGLCAIHKKYSKQ